MKTKFGGVIIFLLMVAVAATPASGSEAYVASASQVGDTAYMALNQDGSMSGPEDLQLMWENGLSGSGRSYGNGIGDFDGDGDLDYIMAVGHPNIGHVYIFPKLGPGYQFDFPVRVASHTEGIYPADMAVADFNGDGKLDFVLSYLYSANCELFLNTGGKGNPFAFDQSVVLVDTGARKAIGMDVADFNNDGSPDFIIAPNSDGPFWVNINNNDDDNSFTTIAIPRPVGANRAYGIAAADFIKDDKGYVDLAVSYPGSLDIYTVIFTDSPDGTFDLTLELWGSYELPMNNSPLDNGDFNRDGNQDLIVGDYGDDSASLALFYGDGQGGFGLDNPDIPIIYTSPDLNYRKAVTALPWIPNKAPVAEFTWDPDPVIVGETVAFNAGNSEDEDGTIVSYKWDYDDDQAVSPAGFNILTQSDSGGNLEEPEISSEYVYFKPGTYNVTLTATDDQGATAQYTAEVIVKPLPVNVYFSPRRLNLKSRDKWITATIRLPAGYDVRMVDPESLYLDVQGTSIKADAVYRHKWYWWHHKKKYRRIRELRAKFDRQGLIEALDGATGEISLDAIGKISPNGDSMVFSGTGTLQTYERKKRVFSGKYNFWKQLMYYCFNRGST